MSGRIAAKIEWASDWDRDAALTTAKLLLEIKAVNFRPEEPYTLTSGWKSPVYIDCRKIIFFPRARAKICDLAVEKVSRHIGYEAIEAIAGGETAGIPFAAWIAERMGTPMAYIRKKPKGFGRNALIEGDVPEGMNTLLVEDLTTDGGSKIQFAKALREAGAICNHTFVVFFYGVFPGSFETLASMDISLHHLCTWWDVLEAAKSQPYFSDSALAGVRKFLENPMAWSAAHGGCATAEEALAVKLGKQVKTQAMDFIPALQTLLGEKAIITDQAERLLYQTDWRGLYKNPALCVVLPESTDQIAAVVKLCAGSRIKIVPQGGNTGLVAGGVPAEGPPQVILSLRRMNKILAFEDDHVIVQTGVVLQTLQEAAAARGRLFPVSLGAEGTAQIGGLISTNAGGVNVLAYGSLRAQVLGLEVVLADGRIWNGLRALHKDNTGYDLKQLFIGAEGTLGVVTAACLKLHPAVAARATGLVGVASVDGAVAMLTALRRASAHRLTLCEFIDGPAMQLAARHVPGAKLPFEAPHYVLVEFSGADAAALNRDMETVLEFALADEFATDAVIAQSDRERLAFLALREAVPEGELREGGAIKHDIAVPIGRIPTTIAAIAALMETKYPACRLNIFGHLGDGNLHVNIRPPAGQSAADLAPVKTLITAAIEEIAVGQGGSFSAEHGIGQMRLPGMLAHKSGTELDMMRAVKAALDPAGLFNPGKLLP